MVKSRASRKNMKKSKKRSRKQRSRRQRGGSGAGWGPGGALVPGSGQPNMVNQVYDSCMSASRPGSVPFMQSGGIPGMKGGAYSMVAPSPVNGFAGGMEVVRDASHCMPNGPNGQRGGAGSLAASAAPILEQSNAAFIQDPSRNFLSSTGANIMVNQPASTLFNSKACGQTGGKGKKLTRKQQNKRNIKNCKAARAAAWW